DRNRSHWSTSKTPSYTKSVSWQHHQDLRKICTPQASLSDEAWEKLMLSDENNKQHIREAIVAMERNNQSNYWEALGKVECPDM
ncbi:YicS family protein, partial [Escherichia coli]|nr:YicS family protein [Escherichia coli]